MITVSALKQNLLNDLAPPKDISCLMLKTPLKLVKRSYNTTIFMWLMIAVPSWFVFTVTVKDLVDNGH